MGKRLLFFVWLETIWFLARVVEKGAFAREEVSEFITFTLTMYLFECINRYIFILTQYIFFRPYYRHDFHG